MDIVKLKNIQEKLVQRVIREGRPYIEYIGGVDLAFSGDRRFAFVTIVVIKFPDLEVVEVVKEKDNVKFPYIPGFLAFRELPPILKALRRVRTKIDLMMVDGHGIAHPRRLGIASHLGVVKNIPTIGVAKSILVGKFETPDDRKGSYSYIYDRDEIIGVVLRTKKGTKPIFLSIGHMISLDYAIEITLKCVKGYRIPEPTRLAHIEVENMRRGQNALW
ncbi:MAG: deoxyribonuclease V [Thermosulfidibacteraceae bacterium]